MTVRQDRQTFRHERQRQLTLEPLVQSTQQRLSDMLPQGVQELDDLRALDGAGEELEAGALEGNAGDDRQLMSVEVMLQDGCFALGRPGAHPGRSLAQSRFVDEEDDSSLFRSVFLASADEFASSA